MNNIIDSRQKHLNNVVMIKIFHELISDLSHNQLSIRKNGDGTNSTLYPLLNYGWLTNG